MRCNSIFRISLVLLSSLIVAAWDATEDLADGGSTSQTVNSVLDVSCIMKGARIVQADADVMARLSMAKRKMRVLRKPVDVIDGTVKAPKTLGDAAEYLCRYINMAYPPTACIEHEGVFYFSGGTTTKAIHDFSSGFAVKQGEGEIYTWKQVDISPTSTGNPPSTADSGGDNRKEQR